MGLLTRCLPLTRRCLSTAAERVTIVEVGPRDGLQNEKVTLKTIVATDDKLELIDRLSDSGLNIIECTSFVSPKWVPQMGDHSVVMKKLAKQEGKRYPVLVPNLTGLDIAVKIRSNVEDIAIFSAASESFSKKNINCTIAESLEKFRAVVKSAMTHKINVRGYVSCIFACPYEGTIQPETVLRVASELLSMGCYEISLGDTIGRGTPGDVETLLNLLSKTIPYSKLALHCHDTYGQALANNLRGLQMGVRTFDSSISGLGGCPYAKGASGNVATEDLVYMLHGLGYDTGCDLDSLVTTGAWISDVLLRTPLSKVTNARSQWRIQDLDTPANAKDDDVL